jgi:hypothetical protein
MPVLPRGSLAALAIARGANGLDATAAAEAGDAPALGSVAGADAGANAGANAGAAAPGAAATTGRGATASTCA